MLRCGGDSFGDGPGVERGGTILCDGFKRGGIGRVLENMPDGIGTAVAVEEVGFRFGRQSRRAEPAEQEIEPVRDCEAFMSEADSRREQVRPGQLAVRLVRVFQQADEAWRADAETGVDGRLEADGAAFLEKPIRARGRGGGLTAVVDCERLCSRVPVQQEGAAPQT